MTFIRMNFIMFRLCLPIFYCIVLISDCNFSTVNTYSSTIWFNVEIFCYLKKIEEHSIHTCKVTRTKIIYVNQYHTKCTQFTPRLIIVYYIGQF